MAPRNCRIPLTVDGVVGSRRTDDELGEWHSLLVVKKSLKFVVERLFGRPGEKRGEKAVRKGRNGASLVIACPPINKEEERKQVLSNGVE